MNNIKGFFQLIPGKYESEKPLKITVVDKVQLKCDCVNRSIVNGCRQPTLFSFALISPPVHKTMQEPKVKLFKKISKSVLSHITIFIKDDDHEAVDFNNEMISFNCQQIKLQ